MQLLVIVLILVAVFFIVRRLAGLVFSIIALVVAVALVAYLVQYFSPELADRLVLYFGGLLRMVGIVV